MAAVGRARHHTIVVVDVESFGDPRRTASCRPSETALACAANCLQHALLYLVGSWDELLEVATAAIASETGNGVAESDFRCRRSEVYAQLHRWADSREDLDQSLAIAQSLGDDYRCGWALNGFAILAYEQGKIEDALLCLQKALTLIQGIDSGRLEAVIEGNLSQAFIGLKRYQEALEHGERGLALRQRCGDLHGEPAALHVLARAWLGLNEHETVMALCGKAITLGRNLGTTSRPPNH